MQFSVASSNRDVVAFWGWAVNCSASAIEGSTCSFRKACSGVASMASIYQIDQEAFHSVVGKR